MGDSYATTRQVAVRDAEHRIADFVEDIATHERERIDYGVDQFEQDDDMSPFDQSVLHYGDFIAGLLPNMDFREAYQWEISGPEVAKHADHGEYALSEGWTWKLLTKDVLYECDRSYCPISDGTTGPWSQSSDNWE